MRLTPGPAFGALIPRAIIDSLPLTIFWKDARSRYLGCNELFARWAGLPNVSSIVDKTDSELAWAEAAPRYHAEDERIIRTGEPLVMYDEPRLSPDGTAVMMRRFKVAVRDAKGEIVGVAGVGELIGEGGGTERRPLSEPDERLRVLIENAADAAVVVQDGRLVLVNARGRKLLSRLSPQLAVVPDMEELIHPQDRERVMRDYREIMGGRATARDSLYELRVLDGEGRPRWLQASTVLLPWSGRPASVHFLVDVTALRRQRRLQEALNSASAAMLTAEGADEIFSAVSRELAVADTALYVFILDPSGQALSTRFWGVEGSLVEKAEKLLGRHPALFSVSLDSVPELRRVVEQRESLLVTDIVSMMKAALPPGLRGLAASLCRLLSLSRLIVAPLVRQDKVLGALAVVNPDLDSRDLPFVTAFAFSMGAALHRARLAQEIAHENAVRRQAQEERALLHAAIEQAAEYVLITDPSGAITYVNPAFERVTGYSREEALGKNPRILKSGRQNPAFYESMWQTLAAGNVWHGQLVNRRKDGGTYTEDATISPVKDGQGRTVSYVAVKHDVTHGLELEERLRQAQKMEAVGRLAGGMAHDFNNILTTITGYADLLLTGLGDEDPRSAEVREIMSAARRASGLTRRLLTFSRKQVASLRLMNLNTVIENVNVMLRRLIGEDVMLVVDLAPDLWPILADTGQIEQVILNLSVNARDAMPEGGTLTFRTLNLGPELQGDAPRAAAAQRVVLVVRDTGTGMSPEVKSHLFEPFFTTKKPGVGTGLGLATVYGVVDQAGGHIEVESEPGKGTEFRLSFPRQNGDVPREEAGLAPTDLPRGRETILLVEDEVAVRSLTNTLLSGLGYSVLEAFDPAGAVRIAEHERCAIDLLLTDVVMPEMRGSELAARFTRLCAGGRVLFMSGYPDDEGLGIGRPGADVHFLPKPFTPESLARKVREALDDR